MLNGVRGAHQVEMLTLRARPLVFPAATLSPNPHRPLNLKPIPSSSSKTTTTMSITTTTSTSETQTQTIEHIVLFKVDPTTPPSKISSMVSSLAGLTSLPQVKHLSVGPILKTHSPFTHLLHSRYSSKHDLASYSSHPDHLSAVRSSVLPICLDILAVDWLSPHRPPSPIPPGSAIRLTLMKAKEEGAVGEVLGLIGGLEGRIAAGGLLELSFGENFSPARAQGFGIASIAVFKGLGDLEAPLDSGAVEEEKVKVRGFLESVIDVDFVVPSDPSASPSL